MRNIIRTIFSLLAALLLCLAASGQSKVVHVTLKNGTTLSGYLKEIDPASHLVVDIAGIDTRIEMDKVAAVQAEELAMTPLTVPEDDSFSEELDVPDSFTLRIGETEVEMVLIRGGDFLMGFDGRYSMDYRSEPIHPVRLNSFYVSKSPLTNGQVTDATGKKQLLAAFSGVFTSQSWARANEAATAIAAKSHRPVRLITESEWEYIAASDRKKLLEWYVGEYDWCHDFYNKEYPSPERRYLNPMGPESGRGHVIRQWDIAENAIYARVDGFRSDALACVRIVIPASEYNH